MLVSPGQPLEPAIAEEMGSAFGHDLGQVRIHADSDAAKSAAAVHARAFTVGRDIVFAASRYSPASSDGRRLLAHELAHVAQDSPQPHPARSDASMTLSESSDPDEVAAEAAAVSALATPTEPSMIGPSTMLLASFHDPTVTVHRQDELPPFEPGPMPRPNRRRGPTEMAIELSTPDLDIDPTELNEPACPARPTRLGNLTPAPMCQEKGEDVDGEEPPYFFCTDSDIFKASTDLARLRQFVSSRPSGTEFRIRAYSSEEGPGASENRDRYNRNLACHRLNRMIRELLNLGVQERQIDAVAMGPTSKFGQGVAGRAANRRAVIEAVRPTLDARPSAEGMSMDQVASTARSRLVAGDYPIAADAYIARWSCGRYRTLADAVTTTNVAVGTPQQATDFLGSPSPAGQNTITLSLDISNATDPIGCAMNRIVDLTFHHIARPVLASFPDQHRAGMHLVHLAGLTECRIPLDPLNVHFNVQSRPDPVDPFFGFLPSCADRPLYGPMPSQRGPSTMDTPPTFISAPITVVNSSGSLVPTGENPFTVGVGPDSPFTLEARVDATGDPAAIARHEVGFVQTVVAENSETTYSDGGRERHRFPLPLRDGPKRNDAASDPPWFSRGSRVRARPGTNIVQLDDAPDLRAFKILPDPSASRYYMRVPAAPGGPNVITELQGLDPKTGPPPARNADEAEQRLALARTNNVPDRGFRRLAFNSWVVARMADPRAPDTHGATQFLAGRRTMFVLNVDWIPSGGRVVGRGDWSIVGRPANPDEASSVLLRGAAPLDFVGNTGVPLYNEIFQVAAPQPRAQQPGALARPDYMLAVQRVVAPHRTTTARRQELIVSVRIQVATGRADLDTPTLARSVIRILNPMMNPINTPEMHAFAMEIFPEIRKIVAAPGFAPNEPHTGTMSIPVTLRAMAGQP